MSEIICHDFKTPRPDSSRRLPTAFLLVPVLFYLAVLGGGALNVKMYLNYRNCVTERDNWTRFQAEKVQARAAFELQQADIDLQGRRAQKLAQWVESTRVIQPVCIAIARSIPAETTLADLTLERSLEMPTQVNLSVHINGGTVQEVGKIQSAVQDMHYRPYNSQQIKNNDNLEYRTTLVWQQL